MAKQRQSGIVGAARRVSDTQGKFQNLGDKFFTGYEKSLETKRKKEEENKAIQGRANTLMGSFKNDIDVTRFKAEDQKLITGKAITLRDDYALLANEAAKIEDKTSAAYFEKLDGMENIKGVMVNMKRNIDNLAATKAEYGANIEKGYYSNAGSNDLALAQGLVMLEYPIGGVDELGNLTWSDEGAGDFNMQDYKLPFAVATNVAVDLGNLSEAAERKTSPYSDVQKNGKRQEIANIFSDPDVLASFIAEGELGEFDFMDLDPADPASKDIVIERVSRSIFDTAAKAAAKKSKSNSASGTKGSGAASNVVKPNLVATVNDMEAFEKEIQTNQFTGPRETRSWSIGGSSNPEQLKIKYDPRTGKWTYLNAKKVSERREADSLSELMTAIPRLFYK